ncbi:MAG: hypothetical protein ABF251_09485 [Nonlabens sp.]|uniref:hypothetical protein n=1 Tax=Nonlabens sp. TaxID=1888209 RepID=UPI00321ACDA3
MKKFIGFLMVAAFILTSCESDTAGRSALTTNVAGTYILTSLVADLAVDFNQDGVFDTELLNEAACFSNMDVDFMVNGDFTSTVAFPEFDAMNVLSCPTGTETGTYILDSSNILTLTVDVNGGTVTEDIQLSLTPTTFEFTVTGQDLDRYITSRAGTPAGNITSLIATYTKI